MEALLISVVLYKMEEAIPSYGLHIFQNTGGTKMTCSESKASNSDKSYSSFT